MFILTLLLQTVYGLSVQSNESIVFITFTPILLIGLVLLLVSKTTFNRSGVLMIIILVVFVVGAVATKPVNMEKDKDENKEEENETLGTFEFKIKDVEHKWIKNKNSKTGKITYTITEGAFEALKEYYQEKEKEKELEQEKIEFEVQTVETKIIVDGSEIDVVNYCPLSVIFETDNCETGQIIPIRTKLEQCEETKLSNSDFKEMDMLISNIDVKSKAKKFSSTLFFLKQMVRTIHKGDKTTLCREKNKLDYLKRNYPEQFIYMKYVSLGKEKQVDSLYKKYEKEKPLNKISEWMNEDTFERYSFKRIVLVTLIIIGVSLVLPLLLNRQAMKYLQTMIIALVILGLLLVAF